MADDTIDIVYEATFRVPKNTTEETLDEIQGLIGDFINDQPDADLLMDVMGRAKNMQTDDRLPLHLVSPVRRAHSALSDILSMTRLKR